MLVPFIISPHYTRIPQVFSYIEATGTRHEQEIASDIILRIVDVVMQNKASLNSQQVG